MGDADAGEAVGCVGWVVGAGRAAAAEAERRFRYPGRKPFDDRLALQGILFVLHTGIGWEHLPQELGFGCGMTAWRRLRAWQEAGVWERLHELLLAELHAAGELEWSRAIADSSHVQAKKGARKPVPARSTGAVRGSKHHLLVDGSGLPLAWTLTGGNRNDVTQLLALLDRVPSGARPCRPAAATDPTAAPRRPRLRPRQVPPPRLAARHQARDRPPPDRARLRPRPDRWVVERTFAWLHNRRRLLVRTDRRHDTHEAFLALACCLICWRRLQTSFSS